MKGLDVILRVLQIALDRNKDRAKSSRNQSRSIDGSTNDQSLFKNARN